MEKRLNYLEPSDFARENGLGWYTEKELESTLANSKTKGAVLFSKEEILFYLKQIADVALNLPTKVRVGKLSGAIVSNIFQKTGLDFTGWSLAFSKDDSRHLYKRHIQNDADGKPLVIEDLLKIPQIMKTATRIKTVSKLREIELRFVSPSGYMLGTVESKSGKTLNVKTFFFSGK